MGFTPIYFGGEKIGVLDEDDGYSVRLFADLPKEALGLRPFLPYLGRAIELSFPEGERLEILKCANIKKLMGDNFRLSPELLVENMPQLSFGEAHEKDIIEVPRILGAAENNTIPIYSIHELSPALFDTGYAADNAADNAKVQKYLSFSGAQPKLSLIAEEVSGNIKFRETSASEHGNVIIKPSQPRFPLIAANEFLIMKTVMACGFDVPPVFLVKDGKERLHYGTARFDIGQGRLRPYIETAALVGLVSSQKYQISTEDFFRKISLLVSPEVCGELALRYFFGYLAGNSDMHAKNFAAQADANGSFILTPMYDMLCVQAALNDDSDLALSLNGSNKTDIAEIVDFLSKYTSRESMEGLACCFKKEFPPLADKVLGFAEAFYRKNMSGYDFEENAKMLVSIPCERADKAAGYFEGK